MKIVIITKSYFPVQSPRAMRATELAQQFSRMGHDVTVYAVNGVKDSSQYTKETGVNIKLIKTNWLPSEFPQSQFKQFLVRLLSFVLGRFTEFPNIEFLFKIPQILKSENNIDLLVTIAFPYPIHWGTAIAKKKLNKKFPKIWVSDCGDPYMGNDVNKPYFYFKYFERFWGDMTDYVTIPVKEAALAYFPNVQNKIQVIPQGFDFSSIRVKEGFVKNNIPSFAYTGTIFPGYRDLTTFLEYLCTLQEEFRFYIYTKTPETILSYKEKLKDKLIISDYIPRIELIFQLSQMDFLINLTNQSTVQSPSKLIDYGLSKRPILDVSTPFVEKDVLKSFMIGDYSKRHPDINVYQYNIEVIAKQFLDLVNSKF